MQIVDICNIKVSNVSFEDALREIDGFVQKRDPSIIVTPNADHIVKLQKDAEFKEVYDNASLVLADGMPLIWAANFLGTSLKEKISGSDLFPRMCELAAEKSYRIFFLGGREGAAFEAAKVLRKRYANIDIAGTYSPPFGFERDAKENLKIVNMIKDAHPDILFVGLGAPKQEKWIYNHYKKLGVPVSIGIGVTFEFVSGMVKRAPVWMQDRGFEWFWRLMMEPKRLWRRYLIDDVSFFGFVLKQKISYLSMID